MTEATINIFRPKGRWGKFLGQQIEENRKLEEGDDKTIELGGQEIMVWHKENGIVVRLTKETNCLVFPSGQGINIIDKNERLEVRHGSPCLMWNCTVDK